ncbi:MAG: DUF3800 domain-containing protein [Candidatus Sulfotelmatobacter sp.]
MLKVYIDDSNVGVEPVSVLAGWAADEETWESFEKEWSAALGMSPRLAYFKETEANGRSGEFAGWSDQSFADRMHLFTRIIGDHKLSGVVSAVPTKLYSELFGGNPDKVLRHPYYFMIYDLVSRVGIYLEKTGYDGHVQFIFDEQHGQQEAIESSWHRVLESDAGRMKELVTAYPIFRSDRTAMALQAADFSAGYLRRDLIEHLGGKERSVAPWIANMANISILGKFWDEEKLLEYAMTDPDFRRRLKL